MRTIFSARLAKASRRPTQRSGWSSMARTSSPPRSPSRCGCGLARTSSTRSRSCSGSPTVLAFFSDHGGARRRDHHRHPDQRRIRVRPGVPRREGHRGAQEHAAAHGEGHPRRADARIEASLAGSRATSCSSKRATSSRADARLVYSADLRVNNSALTGEVDPVVRRADVTCVDPPSVTDIESFIFTGSTAVLGAGRAVVYATGMNTEFGKIAGSLRTSKSGCLRCRSTSIGCRGSSRSSRSSSASSSS